MTETTFLPVAAWAAWAAAAALERPTLARQALLVAAVAAACATRVQALVLVPVLVVAAVAYAALVRSPRAVTRLWPTWAALAAAALAWAAWRLAQAGGASQLLGGYAAAGESSPPLADVVADVVRHLGGLVWLVGVAPAIALVVLLVRARGEPPEPREAALLAVSAALALGLVLQVGIFAAAWVPELAERGLLAAVPPLFLVLCLWLDRGAPRPRRATAIAALALATLVALVPFDAWATPAALVNAPSLALLAQHDVAAAGWIGAAAVAAVVVLLPRRLLVIVPVVLVGAFVAGSEAAADGRNAASQLLLTRLVGPDRTWIDDAADAPTALLYDGEAHWNGVWVHAFWNRRVEAVATLPGEVVPGPMPQAELAIAPDGRVSPQPAAAYAVAPSTIELAGAPVVEAVQQETAQRALVLWRLDGPLRLRSRRTGVQANGDVYAAGRLTVWDCRRGRLVLTLLGKGAAPIEVVQDDRVEQVVHVPNGEAATVEVEARPRRPGGVCTFDARSETIFGTTQFRFERA
jgi:hypothetical protein